MARPLATTPVAPFALSFGDLAMLAGGAAGMASLICAGLHLALVPMGGSAMFSMSLPMLALALICSNCGWHFLRGEQSRVGLAMMAAVGTTMVVVHLHMSGAPARGPSDSMAGMDHSAGLLGVDYIERMMLIGAGLGGLQIVLVVVIVAARRFGR